MAGNICEKKVCELHENKEVLIFARKKLCEFRMHVQSLTPTHTPCTDSPTMVRVYIERLMKIYQINACV